MIMKTRKFGLNISKITENALEEYLKRIENLDYVKAEKVGFVSSFWCGRRDLNPGSQAWKACVLTRLDDGRKLGYGFFTERNADKMCY